MVLELDRTFAVEVPKNDGAFFWEPVLCRRPRYPAEVAEPPLKDGLALAHRPVRGWRAYKPLDEPTAIYRELGAITGDAASVLAAAHRHGHVGLSERVERMPSTGPGEWLVETLGTWRLVIAALGEWVGVWDAIRTGDGGALAERFRRDGAKYLHKP